MKQSQTDKYNIAWFKLSEFVARGEKEKALGIYKLLTLSINDIAFKNKLEGDILFAFNDINAIDKYYKAAILYQKDQRFIEAAAIFENLLTLQPYQPEYLKKLLNTYENLNFKEKKANTLAKLYVSQLKHDDSDAQLTLKKLNEIINNEAQVAKNIIFIFISENIEENLIIDYISKVTEYYLNNYDSIQLNKFLSKLETINEKYYKLAIKSLK